MNGHRLRWSTGPELMAKMAGAYDKGIDALYEFTNEVARDYRDHVEEHGRRRVLGYCPMGCGETLFLAAQGIVQCVHPDCPDLDAVTRVIFEPEIQHVVTLQEDGWQAKHPLRERIGDELLTCEIGNAVLIMCGQRVEPGKYRVMRSPIGPGGWSWERLDDSPA